MRLERTMLRILTLKGRWSSNCKNYKIGRSVPLSRHWHLHAAGSLQCAFPRRRHRVRRLRRVHPRPIARHRRPTIRSRRIRREPTLSPKTQTLCRFCLRPIQRALPHRMRRTTAPAFRCLGPTAILCAARTNSLLRRQNPDRAPVRRVWTICSNRLRTKSRETSIAS